MTYVDGFVLAVPSKNMKAYKKMASDAAKMWKKHGALGYFECMGDDLQPDTHGAKILQFPKLVKLKKGETVWFSFIMYKSKKHRDQVNKKVMKDHAMQEACTKNKKMPFDLKRMAWGGFKAMVEEKNK